MSFRSAARRCLALLAAACMPAFAAQPVKVGLIAPFSGPFADYGRQIHAGIKAYFAIHGDTFAGRQIVVVPRDTTGPNPEIAKRLAQELVVREKVDFLAGFGLTPEALAVAPVATEARTPMIVMNAATSVITTRSPYIARFSMTLPQVSAPMATWAAKNGLRNVYTLVADYGPGLDAEAAFRSTFTEAGGRIVDSVRVPLRNPDFAPYIQRIKDAAPEAVFIFVPAGEQGVAFMKGFAERGLAKAGIKVIATGDLTDDHVLQAMGEPVLGVITTFHYSAAHDSPRNREFLAAFRKANAELRRPNFMAVAGFDGMHAIAEAVRRHGAALDADKAMAVIKSLRFESPRGPIAIDPATRDIVQTVYVRRVERRDGELYNVEFDRFADVKDPGKE